MKIDILISGSGGQGIMSLGKFLAELALTENKNVTWFPSYGAEMRGGSAHCFVRISNNFIGSPLIEKADIGIIMNQMSLEKFENKIKKTGIIILNKDLINKEPARNDLKKFPFPFNKISLEFGDLKFVNTLALGVLVSLTGLFKESNVIKVLKKTFSVNRNLFEINLKVFKKGVEIGKS